MDAVIYARYSSAAQHEQSIEGQLHDCRAWAERNDMHIVHEYIDRALTGKNDDRPAFQQMLVDAQRHTFQRVIVWKLDRFARNRYDSAIHKANLKRHNVRVVSATENVGEGDESILMEAMLEAMAEYFSADLRRKVIRGTRETLAKGLYPGGAVPYGYKVDNQRLVANDKELPIIR